MLHRMTPLLRAVKEQNPLIHQITNFVSMNDCANITLAIGASPVMAQAMEEVEEMVVHARALVLNMGTLQSRTVEAMLAAGKRAKDLSIPVVLDPVGVGATRMRMQAAKRLLSEVRPAIVRCNLSELKALCGIESTAKGVDSATDATGAETAARQFAKRTGCVIAVTGAVDIVTDGREMVLLKNGHSYLRQVTGTGCMTTALTACFASVGDPFCAAAAGAAVMGIAGQIAAAELTGAEGIGTFKVRLFDAVFRMEADTVQQYLRFEE